MSFLIDRRANARHKNMVNRRRFMERYKQHIKRAVQEGVEMSLDAGLALERELQNRLFVTSDAKEGIGAYMEKRKAEFTGK